MENKTIVDNKTYKYFVIERLDTGEEYIIQYRASEKTFNERI